MMRLMVRLMMRLMMSVMNGGNYDIETLVVVPSLIAVPSLIVSVMMRTMI
jgi:hypothetical protein